MKCQCAHPHCHKICQTSDFIIGNTTHTINNQFGNGRTAHDKFTASSLCDIVPLCTQHIDRHFHQPCFLFFFLLLFLCLSLSVPHSYARVRLFLFTHSVVSFHREYVYLFFIIIFVQFFHGFYSIGVSVYVTF